MNGEAFIVVAFVRQAGVGLVRLAAVVVLWGGALTFKRDSTMAASGDSC